MTQLSLSEFLIVGAGGALGAVGRFAMQSLDIFSNGKFYITAAINLTGCLLIGIVWALFHQFGTVRPAYLFIIAGFLGGYTTYSTFAFDTFDLARCGRWMEAALYVSVTLAGGFAACAAGYFLTDKLAGRL